jgi:probable phosphoglycerate mutase
MPTRYLYLVRHGDYQEFEGEEGPLRRTGRRQARAAGRALAHLPIEAIHASELPRALETARLLAQAFPRLEVTPTALLRECAPALGFGVLSDPRCVGGLSLPRVRARLERDPLFRDRLARRWAKATGRPAPSNEQAERAFQRFFVPAPDGERHEVLVTHGNLIRYLCCRVLGVLPEAWTEMGTFNCGISRVVIQDGPRRLLVSYNDFGHLPLQLRTGWPGGGVL